MMNSREKKIALFAWQSAITLIAQLLNLVISLTTSIILARFLGPERKGMYTLAVLLPTLITTFINIGIGQSSVYQVAKRNYPLKEILGHNIVFSIGIGCFGIVGSLLVLLLFRHSIIPGIPRQYLFLALPIIPLTLFFIYLQSILLGGERLKEYNLISIISSILGLLFLVISVCFVGPEVSGVIIAGVLALTATNITLFRWVKNYSDGITFNWNPPFVKESFRYGFQTYLSNILAFLNYKIDMFLVNGFLNPAALGFYSIGVGLVEKLWLVSHSVSIVLFPKVAKETDEYIRNEFTPFITRTIFWITVLGALILFFLSPLIVEVLYSKAFLPSVRPLQILLIGIIALSVSRVLANDLAGRGKPMLNTYGSAITVAINIILNLIWIPKYQIEGAAWASTISYGVALFTRLFFYCRISGNSLLSVLLPQRNDWAIYRRVWVQFFYKDQRKC